MHAIFETIEIPILILRRQNSYAEIIFYRQAVSHTLKKLK